MDQANSQSVGGVGASVGAKRSYCDELGYSAPSKRPRTQPSHCRFIDSLMLSLTGENTFPRLNFSRCNSDDQELLVVTTRKLEYCEPAGYMSRIRLIVENNQSYKVQVNFRITINIVWHGSVDMHEVV